MSEYSWKEMCVFRNFPMICAEFPKDLCCVGPLAGSPASIRSAQLVIDELKQRCKQLQPCWHHVRKQLKLSTSSDICCAVVCWAHFIRTNKRRIPQHKKKGRDCLFTCPKEILCWSKHWKTFCVYRAGCLVLFMSNELLQEQTSTQPQALLPQLSRSIVSVELFKESLIRVKILHKQEKRNGGMPK